MTVFATQERLYTIEEYLEMEKQSFDKHEYYKGKIILMPGGSFNHSLIAGNIITALNNALEMQPQSFMVTTSDVKIFVPRVATFVYPDAVVVFEKPEFYQGHNDVITNPLLVVEVASPSTAKHDRTLKFRHYKSLPSFKEYVIIEQDFPWVIASYKTAENTWNDSEADQLDQSIFLRSVNCNIHLKNIYKKVEFAKPV